MAVEHGVCNQLQFNLGNTGFMNVSSRFRDPQPLVIEKIGSSSVQPTNMNSPADMLKFSNISQESLVLAVELAKRDLKLKNEKKEAATIRKPNSRTSSPYRSSVRIVRSSGYKNKLKKREQRSSPLMLNLQEKHAGKTSRNTRCQTDWIVDRPNATHVKRDLSSLPARSMSPPTRDDGRIATHEEKVLSEICRLRKEMMKCLQQIKSITMQHDYNTQKRDAPLIYDEDIEDDRKRQMRVEERASRSARFIYMLTCQSNELQEEIKKLDKKSKIDAKKSQLTSRLATIHRGVVKALQMLVKQMSDIGSHKSIPRGYHDLAVIIRQLSISCAQLEVTTESVVTDDVLSLLKDVVELNNMVDKDSAFAGSAVEPKSPPRLCRSTARTVEVKNTNKSNSYYALPDLDVVASRDPIEKVRLTSDQSKETIQKISSSPVGMRVESQRNKPSFRDEVSSVEGKTVDADRQMVLADGLKRLLSAKRQNENKPTWGVNDDRTCVGRAKFHKKLKSCCSEKSHLKGVLINEPRHRSSSPAVIRRAVNASTSMSDFHFAEPTFSRTQKEVSAADPNRSQPPTPQLTPRPSRPALKNNANVLNRQVDHDSYKNLEERIRERINPMVEKNHIMMDLDLVTDRIMGDVMMDVARDLHERKNQNSADYRTSLINDSSDVDAILRRLHQMEMEQSEIRRRWASLSYEDDDYTAASVGGATYVGGATHGGGNYSDFVTPDPFELTSESRIHTTALKHFQPARTEPPILFTRPTSRSRSFFSSQFDESGRRKDNGVVLTMSEESIANIKRQVTDFNDHIKRQIGDERRGADPCFDPWKVVDLISDEILENCVTDVCLELEDINKELTDHVYKTEFSLIPETSCTN